jgi:5-formaminoimidazole-4-carboxamide-1-(beta)-D-ribofuranosyl 5'-monophosphate synthetase
MVGDYGEILDDDFQEELLRRNAIIIPHGSFVEYVGPKNLEEKFFVPMFGNRKVLDWEGDRRKEMDWLQRAGLTLPRVFRDPSEIDRLCIVKFHGAKGGRGFFIVNSREEFEKKMIEARKNFAYGFGPHIIQEYILGLRYYPHYFYSPILGRVELLSIDRRDESNIDGLYRIGASRKEIEDLGSYVVTGNLPVIVRESLLPKLVDMGERVVKASLELFPPGMIGPFCLETICRDDLEFVTFEISARIVAGTNLYPLGSQYSCYIFEEPMSTGRRISREIRLAIDSGRLGDVVY